MIAGSPAPFVRCLGFLLAMAAGLCAVAGAQETPPEVVCKQFDKNLPCPLCTVSGTNGGEIVTHTTETIPPPTSLAYVPNCCKKNKTVPAYTVDLSGVYKPSSYSIQITASQDQDMKIQFQSSIGNTNHGGFTWNIPLDDIGGGTAKIPATPPCVITRAWWVFGKCHLNITLQARLCAGPNDQLDYNTDNILHDVRFIHDYILQTPCPSCK